MEPVYHVVREIWDGDIRVIRSEVISTYESGNRDAMKAAAAEARALQEGLVWSPDLPGDVVFQVALW